MVSRAVVDDDDASRNARSSRAGRDGRMDM